MLFLASCSFLPPRRKAAVLQAGKAAPAPVKPGDKNKKPAPKKK